MALLTCDFCMLNSIRPKFDAFFKLHGCTICKSCADLITSDANLERPGNDFDAVYALPPKLPAATVKKLSVEHVAEFKYICNTCTIELCEQEREQHADHDLALLEDAEKVDYKTVERLELLLSYYYFKRPNKDTNLYACLQKSFQRLYSGLPRMSSFERILCLRELIAFAAPLSTGIPESKYELEVADLYHYLRQGPTPSPYTFSYLSWTAWNTDTLMLMNIENDNTQVIHLRDPEKFAIPYYSRLIALPTGSFFLCGGRPVPNATTISNAWELQSDNETEMRVRKLPDMLGGHSNHAIVYFEGYVYVIAGCDEANIFCNRCERFNIYEENWELIASTNQTRDSISAVLDPRASRIFIAGGRIDNGYLSKDFEVYEIAKDTWIELAVYLPDSYDMLGLALLPVSGTKILVFGGLNSLHLATNHTCIVDIDTGKVEVTSPMNSEGGCIVDELRLIGGHVYSLCFMTYKSRDLERWNMTTQRWETLNRLNL